MNDLGMFMTYGIFDLFLTILMIVLVFKPLASTITKNLNENKLGNMIIIVVLVVLKAALTLPILFTMPFFALVLDFFVMFIGGAVIIPISQAVKSKNNAVANTNQTENNNIKLNCAKCGAELTITDKFCGNCGEPFDGNNVTVSAKKIVTPDDYDAMFKDSEEMMLDKFIKNELTKAGVDIKTKLIPESVLIRKNILSIIYAILVFVYVTLIFFHFPIYTYVLGIIILIVFYVMTNKYNFMKYLVKEIKSRPSEKISNIVMSVKENCVKDTSIILRLISIVSAIAISLILFINPRIMYEKTNGGYGVRYYAFGLTNFKEATIPAKYKGKDVVSLRGNTFSNMPYLEKVTLPDTITEIRGQAFKNCGSLKEVNIPKNLEYLGGGAFYNCKSITSITLPETLTFLGGEAFYNASNLKEVKLSSNLTEIRGDTFEYCASLETITIPDNITRIGGHAFYGDTNLKEVNISSNSNLTEIGSSAFRRCYSLSTITIPRNVYVNERAFKESPTIVNYYGEGE